ncbi:MAG TPA: hypothetical protein VF902_09710 [Coriobacteriia bacterium]
MRVLFTLRSVARGAYRELDVPVFKGAVIEAGLANEAAIETPALRSVARGRRVFLVSHRAGFLYLATGLENPTPYDYPTAGIIGGRDGEAIKRAILDGRVEAVWMDDRYVTARDLGIEPVEFEKWVQTEMVVMAKTNMGSLYERAPAK